MSEVLPRLTPALSDKYRIERELGAGGMATVFRAHDLRHDRDVAIKVLHPELAAMLGAQRFLGEIRTTAKLQHPHILPLLDSGEADGLLFYVMPVVDGESLRTRLDRETQLPVDEAIRITREVASALDYSHRHGVIHRDIKPENILLHDGQALVADFGIALAVSNAGGERMTATGLSLGTPQYMSPEQATGERTVDARSDVYSLGCVLYEMLTGAPPFAGATAQAIIAQVITTTPNSVTAQRPTVPMYVDAAISRALQKIPADRFQSISVFAAALSGATSNATSAAPISARRARRWTQQHAWPIVVAISAAAGLAGGALAHRAMMPPAAVQPTVHLSTAIARGNSGLGGLTIASDGRFAIVAGGNDSRLFLRRIDAFDVVQIPGTEGAQNPFLSPDDQWVAFTAAGRLHKVRLDGGPIADVADATWGSGTWGPGGTIVYTPASGSGLWRTSADGGKPEQVTTPDTSRGEFSHEWPQFLPDGHTIVFTNYRTPFTTSKIEALDLRTQRRKVLVDGAIGGVYVRSGHLLFSRGTATVFAVRFNAERLETQGDPKPVLDDVDGNPAQGRILLAVSSNGTLAFLPQSQWTPKRALEWVDRTGKESLAISQPGYYATPRISPDGRKFAYATMDEGRDIWLYDRARSFIAPVTHGGAADFDPIWTPDGQHLVYMSERGAFEIYWRRSDLTTPEESLITNHVDKFPSSVSHDGKLLAYTEWDDDRNIKFAALDGSRDVPVFPNTRRNEEHAAFSPDERWIAFVSDESGKNEVYARPFPNMSARRIQISTDGGTEPHWTKGGREIVFRRGDAMLASAFDPATGAPAAPVVVFALTSAYDGYRNTYDVTPDGTRFLIAKPLYPSAEPTVAMVVNWFPELRGKLAK
jgi:eukaryotic-like serine/threonine-protein kinase